MYSAELIRELLTSMGFQPLARLFVQSVEMQIDAQIGCIRARLVVK